MIPTSQCSTDRVDHPVVAGRRPATAWFAARATSLGSQVAFIFACGLVLAAPGTLGTAVVSLLAALAVALFIQRVLNREAWSYVPGTLGRGLSARGDTYTEPAPYIVEFCWFLLEAAVWVVGGALILATVPGPWSAGFLLFFGAYMVTVTGVMCVRSQARGHWLLKVRTLIFGAMWIGQGMTAEPGLIGLWPLLLAEIAVCAVFTIVVRTIKGYFRASESCAE